MKSVIDSVQKIREQLVKWIDKNRLLRIPHETIVRYNNVDGGDRSALITYYSFLSLLPLLLVALTIFDIVLRNNAALHQRLLDSTFQSIPVVGETLNKDLSFVKLGGLTLFVSVIILLWAARRGGLALEKSLCEITHANKYEPANFFVRLGRAYSATALVGLGVIIPTLTLSYLQGEVWEILGVFLSLGWNVLIVYLVYKLLIRKQTVFIPGAIVAGTILTIIQRGSVLILAHSLEKSRPLYGALATVLVLLAWISFQVQAVVIGAVVNQDRYGKRH